MCFFFPKFVDKRQLEEYCIFKSIYFFEKKLVFFLQFFRIKIISIRKRSKTFSDEKRMRKEKRSTSTQQRESSSHEITLFFVILSRIPFMILKVTHALGWLEDHSVTLWILDFFGVQVQKFLGVQFTLAQSSSFL